MVSDIIAVIKVALKLFLMVFSVRLEKNKKKQAFKKEGLQNVLTGIEADDPNIITAGFDKLNRLC